MVLSHPNAFGPPVFSPESFSPAHLPPISEPPQWFQGQFGMDRPEWPRVEGVATPAGAPADNPSAARATSASTRPSTRSTKGKERASSPGPSSATTSSTPATTPARSLRTRSNKPAASASASAVSRSNAANKPSAPTAPPALAAAKPSGDPTRPSSAGSDQVEELPSANRLKQSARSSESASGSPDAPIDVDAMQVDSERTSEGAQGHPIKTSHLGAALRVRGSEFAQPIVHDRDWSASTDGRAASPTEVREVTVPRIEGSFFLSF